MNRLVGGAIGVWITFSNPRFGFRNDLGIT